MITRRVATKLLVPCLLCSVVLSACASVIGNSPGGHPSTGAEDPLPAWSNTLEKQTILHYVAEVTRPGGSGYIPPEARDCAFDRPLVRPYSPDIASPI